MKGATKKRILQGILFLSVCMITLQFIQPNLENPPVISDIKAPNEVKAILRRSCFDCHSNETKLRWFDRISPVSWKIAEHIENARSAFNFSEWDHLTAARQKDILWEGVNHAILGFMPLKEYTTMHPSARLSDEDITVLKNYVSGFVDLKRYDSTKTKETFNQFDQWLKGIDQQRKPVAANGVEHDPDYKNWQAISTTDAFANGTLRVIFGNAIAVKAIREKNTKHWPNGTTFAKVQWDQLPDEEGNIHTGKFNQIEYMIKDDKKYASTEGWGWARFKTLQLIPDGKNASLANECINCHRPVKDDDFVFTFPIKQ